MASHRRRPRSRRRRLSRPAVVLTTGTFLQALCTPAKPRRPAAGRAKEPRPASAAHSSGSAFELARFKTGTPPRLNGRTIDYGRMRTAARRRRPAAVFVFSPIDSSSEQLPCWITYTNEAVHDLIRANLHRAPMYTGQIQSRGPRYCPSIEDKVVRFADKDAASIVPGAGRTQHAEVYVNGISTSLPRDVQDAMFRLIPGLEQAEIMRYGYAVEYDLRSARSAAADAGNEARRRACTSPGRSTARPATKKPRRRA